MADDVGGMDDMDDTADEVVSKTDARAREKTLEQPISSPVCP